ncbi:MAG: hypothetical protein MJ077_07980 [Oscillospiraceae bacterium]|nr:hypothetical protein [Oscillospiraceae bacterium]
MREQINQFPPALQRQLLRSGAVSALLLCLTLLILLFYRDIRLWLPTLFFGALLCAMTVTLYQTVLFQRYVVIEGQCLSIESTVLKKRVTALLLQTPSGLVRLSVHQRIGFVREGDTIRLYAAERTPVYQQEQCKVLCSFLALEVIPQKIVS